MNDDKEVTLFKIEEDGFYANTNVHFDSNGDLVFSNYVMTDQEFTNGRTRDYDHEDGATVKNEHVPLLTLLLIKDHFGASPIDFRDWLDKNNIPYKYDWWSG